MDLVCRSCDDGGRAVCMVSGEIDLSTAAQLESAAREAMAGSGPDLGIDLSGVTFMDARGITALLRIRTEARSHGGCLHIVTASRQVMRVLAVTKTLDVLPVDDHPTPQPLAVDQASLGSCPQPSSVVIRQLVPGASKRR